MKIKCAFHVTTKAIETKMKIVSIHQVLRFTPRKISEKSQYVIGFLERKIMQYFVSIYIFFLYLKPGIKPFSKPLKILLEEIMEITMILINV